MSPFQFYYKDQWYRGSYVISGTPAHGFFWCFPESEELARAIGQCVIFNFSNGRLLPARVYDTTHEELVEAIRLAILPLYEEVDTKRRQ